MAKILKGVVEAEKPDIVILGKQAIDDDCNQTGQMLAALLGWAQATFTSKLEPGAGEAHDHPRDRRRPADAQGQDAADRHHRPSPQPAALCLAAQHHEGEEEAAGREDPADYGVDVAPRLKVVKTEEPPKRQAGVKVKSPAELVAKLKEAGAI